MSSQPTMSDVARLAGVDASTVSRALNGRTPSSLRPETVAKVQAAAEQLGYRPNVLARGLRTQRTHTIGLLVPDVTNPFFPRSSAVSRTPSSRQGTSCSPPTRTTSLNARSRGSTT